MEIIKDFWLFLRDRKKFWLAPLIVFLLLIALLIAVGSSSVITPFVYSVF